MKMVSNAAIAALNKEMIDVWVTPSLQFPLLLHPSSPLCLFSFSPHSSFFFTFPPSPPPPSSSLLLLPPFPPPPPTSSSLLLLPSSSSQGERCSFSVQMWHCHLHGLRHDLWTICPGPVAVEILTSVLARTLSHLARRYTAVQPSYRRVAQFR